MTNGNESVDKAKEPLVQLVEFWEGVKLNSPLIQLQQILLAFDQGSQNPKYLEFACKCIRRALELSLGTFPELEDLLAVKLKTQDFPAIESKAGERLDYLQKDIVRKQRRRFNLLEEKVKQIQETGG